MASIAAMEIVEISLALLIPGFMQAGLRDALFWLGLGKILPTGYAVAYAATYWVMKREQGKSGCKRAATNFFIPAFPSWLPWKKISPSLQRAILRPTLR